jgi:hypothetical protein
MNSVMQSQETKDIQPFTSIAKEFCIYDKTDEEIADALIHAWRLGIVFLVSDGATGNNEFWYKEGGKEKSTLISQSDYDMIKGEDPVLSGFSRTPKRGALLTMIKRGRDRYMNGERFRERAGRIPTD